MAEVSKAAAKVAEVAADGVAETLHVVGEEALAAEAVVEGISKVRLEFLVIGIAAGAAVGAFVGYKAAVKRLEARYEVLMEEEGERLREHYQRRETALKAREEKPTLEKVTEELGYTGDPRTPQVVPPTVPRPEPEEVDAEAIREEPRPPAPVVKSVFANGDDTWDYKAEEVNRQDPEVPYVIHIDEFRSNDADHEQMTWTYYAGDDVLANESDEEVDQDATVGVKNLGKFGHGSGDPNVVYVRNVHNAFDVEIQRSHGTFAHEVKGLDDHNIRHSDDASMRRRVRRFDDE